MTDVYSSAKLLDGPDLIAWGSSTLTPLLLEHGLAGRRQGPLRTGPSTTMRHKFHIANFTSAHHYTDYTQSRSVSVIVRGVPVLSAA